MDRENLDRRMLLAGVGLVGAAAALSRPATAGQLNPPPGPVAPTQATPVQSLAGDATSQYIISQTGAYVLTGNIQSVAGKDGIAINASGVTLDLAGFTMSDALHTNTAIASLSASSVTIRNGHVEGWATGIRNTAGGLWAVSGLNIRNVAGKAITLANAATVRDVNVSNCQDGILLEIFGYTAAENCRVTTLSAASAGIASGHATNCDVNAVSGGLGGILYGINCIAASNCMVQNISAQASTMGINCTSASECTVLNVTGPNAGGGINAAGLVSHCTVQFIGSQGGSNFGITCSSAVGCQVAGVQQSLPGGGQCWGIRGGEITACTVSQVIGNTGQDTAGIATSEGLASNCYVSNVANIGSGGAYGIQLLGSRSSCNGCNVSIFNSAGVGIFGIDARIADNRVQGGATGIQAIGRSFVVGNFVAQAPTSYNYDVATTIGPVTFGGGVIAVGTIASANFYVA